MNSNIPIQSVEYGVQAVMEDSVIAADVRTHERDAIESGSSVKSSHL